MLAGLTMLVVLLCAPSVVGVVVELVVETPAVGYAAAGLTAVILFVVMVANADPYDIGWEGVYFGAAVMTVIPLLFAFMAVLVAQALKQSRAEGG